MDNLRDISPQTGMESATERRMDMAADEEPLLVDHYRLVRELGRGFSSIVYEAADERRQRTVALKVLTFLSSLTEERRVDLAERFRREAQAVSTLSHPNIVAIYDVGQADDGRQYIAMECLPGETLRQCLRRVAPLSVPEAVAIAAPIADALHYAHGRGVIHRDIKPDNIFLAENAGLEATPKMPKLMDFGIAHLLTDQGLTQDGTIVGSPAYMSPEQINGLALDARTDIFSLAVTLTEMVTGTKPFEGETIPAVMQQILRHAPDLRAVPDRRLARVLTRALSKNPAARYPDAAAFADALRQAAPLAAAAPSVATQIITGVPRISAVKSRPRPYARWGAVGVGGLALAALAALPLANKRPVPSGTALTDSRSLPQHVSPAPSVRPALGTGSRRRMISAVWHPATRRPTRLAREGDSVRISEITPVRRHFSYYARPALYASVTQPPKSPLAPQKPASPARPSLPARPNPPTLAVAGTPVVRVAGVRQELTPVNQARPDTIPETDPATEEIPPPRPQERPDAPPRALHCPMPDALADLDSPSATVRLRLSVDENGDVTEATILTSSGSRELDDAALDAVGQWKYEPAVKNGRSAPGVVIEKVKFTQQDTQQ